MDYDDRAFGQQEQEEAHFFHTLADIHSIIETFGPSTFFYHLLESYPELKKVIKKYV